VLLLVLLLALLLPRPSPVLLSALSRLVLGPSAAAVVVRQQG
jgi:hypothetical protein